MSAIFIVFIAQLCMNTSCNQVTGSTGDWMHTVNSRRSMSRSVALNIKQQEWDW